MATTPNLTTQTRFQDLLKEITYDRVAREYKASYDGHVVGWFASYHAAECALNEYVYEMLSARQIVRGAA